MNGLIWFRRDLRINDNPALNRAIKQGVKDAVYISTPEQWETHSVSHIQADFIQRHLVQLSRELTRYGIRLNFIEATTYEDQACKLAEYCESSNCSTVFLNREYGIDEVQRDERISVSGIEMASFHSETILDPGSVLNKSSEMYRVFTPFRNRWLERVRTTGLSPLEFSEKHLSSSYVPVEINTDYTGGYPRKDSGLWPLSQVFETYNLPEFLRHRLGLYSGNRDFPARNASSKLSPYLAIGAISARSIAHEMVSHSPEVLYDHSHPAFSWLNELIWRDFYKHLLFFYPALSKGESFQPKYRSVNWPSKPELFEAWCGGRTGYPLVDAAMRQLVTTGWMHNRLRMVTASFLSKHLLIDWRLGERFFRSQLIDGDVSANNGGWQWAAGTGCDAQPWFRIFNPVTQSRKFDPEGAFIRMYLPELESVPDRYIHFPHEYLEKQGRSDDYWPPIVDHQQARQEALSFYKDSVVDKES